MAVYRLTNRDFSRQWRRSKSYRENEIRWLARRRGLKLSKHRHALQLFDPKTNKLVANFQEVVQNEVDSRTERNQMLAALRLGLYLFLAFPALAQTYQEKLVASVLMGEAWGEGERGMIAVAEVIHQRSKEQRKSPMQTVLVRHGVYYSFSCLNRRGPDRLIRKFQHQADYRLALKIACTVCREPGRLPGITRGANHYYARNHKKPLWAVNQKALVIVGNHAFYRI